MPVGTILLVAIHSSSGGMKLAETRAHEIADRGVELADRSAIKSFPHKIETACGEWVDIKHFRIYKLLANKNYSSKLPELLIDENSATLAAVKILLPERKRNATPIQFDLVQMEGRRVVGGCTVQVQLRRSKALRAQAAAC